VEEIKIKVKFNFFLKKEQKQTNKQTNGHLIFLSPMWKIKYQVAGLYIPPNVEKKTLGNCLIFSSLCGKENIN